MAAPALEAAGAGAGVAVAAAAPVATGARDAHRRLTTDHADEVIIQIANESMVSDISTELIALLGLKNVDYATTAYIVLKTRQRVVFVVT